MKKLLYSILTIAICLFITGKIQAATLTVCASGCSYTTIQSAITASSTGDTIKLGPGSYPGFTLNKQVTIVGENYNQTNPRANTSKITSTITVNGNWAWDQGPVFTGLSLHDAAYAIIGFAPYTIQYSHIVADGNDGVSFEPGGGGIVRGNIIEHTGDDCIDVDNQTKDIVIENNQMLDCGQDGIEIRQMNDPIASRITLTFRNNIVDVTGQDGMQIMDYNNFTNRRYILQRNIFRSNGKAAIGLMVGDVTQENYSAAAMPEPLYAINNTFINNDAAISGGANLIAINNIFSGQRTFDLKAVGGRSKIMNSVFATAPKLQGTNNLDTASTRTGDPKLDTSFVPQSGSSAIDAGIASYSHSYVFNSNNFTDEVINYQTGTDFSGSAPDIGAKESNFTVTPIVTVTPTLNPTITTIATPTLTISNSPTPILSPTGTFSCPKKYIGDSDCKQTSQGVYKVDLLDYAIWYSEFIGGCSESTLAKCGSDADGNGNAMDANFNFPGTSYMLTDTKVDVFDYAVWIQGFLVQ